MKIKIHDIDKGTVRTVSGPDECFTAHEKSGVETALQLFDLVTMGTTIFEPVK